MHPVRMQDGVWGRVQVGGGGWSACWKQEKRSSGWGGWGVGTEKEPASECTRVCQNYPLANYYPLISLRYEHVAVCAS